MSYIYVPRILPGTIYMYSCIVCLTYIYVIFMYSCIVCVTYIYVICYMFVNVS